MNRFAISLLLMILFASCETRERVVQVSVASSLEPPIASAANTFETQSGISVIVNADASSRLARQIENGAPFDVFISADAAWAEHVSKTSAIEKLPFTTGEVVLAVRPGTEVSRDSFCSSWRIGAALPEVPLGKYTDRFLDEISCEPTVQRGPNAALVRTWLTTGVVDAAFIYRSDLNDAELIEATEAGFGRTDAQYWIVARDDELTHRFLTHARKSLDIKGVDQPSVSAYRVVRNSIGVGLLSVLLGLIPAIFIGRVLARRDFFGKSIVSTIVMAPLVLPPVVTGLWLLEIFSPTGFVGRFFSSVGLEVAFGWTGALFASLAVSFPLFVMVVRNAFEVVDTKYENISAACGMSPNQTFFRVTLPLAYPGIIGGALLAFARSMGEFGATAVVAGNLAADDGTIALAIYRALQNPAGEPLVWSLSGFAIAISLAAFLGYESFVRWQKRRLET